GLGAVLARALVLRPSLALFLASAFAARLLVLVAFAGFASRPRGALLVASVRRRLRIRLRLVLLLLLLLGGLLFGPQTQQRLQVASRHLVVGITLQRGPEGRDGARQIALLRVQVPQAVQGLARGPARGERPRKGLLGLVVSAQRAQRQATVPVDLAPLGARPGRAVEMRERGLGVALAQRLDPGLHVGIRTLEDGHRPGSGDRRPDAEGKPPHRALLSGKSAAAKRSTSAGPRRKW